MDMIMALVLGLILVYMFSPIAMAYDMNVSINVVKPPARIGLLSSAIITMMMGVGFVMFMLKTLFNISSSGELINKLIFVLVALLAVVSAVGIILTVL
jgi:hypothetical protein